MVEIPKSTYDKLVHHTKHVHVTSLRVFFFFLTIHTKGLIYLDSLNSLC